MYIGEIILLLLLLLLLLLFCVVLQTELLQSQSEVRMLLDRVSESSRNRAEMVSSKIHNQLMSIADEKAAASERCAQMMEREVRSLSELSSTVIAKSFSFACIHILH